MSNIVWSFSSLKTFQQCPKKYYHTKIARDIVEPDTTATLYGKSAHTVAEEYIRDGKEVPAQFEYMKPTLDVLSKLEGDKLCEVKLGLTKNLETCGFDATNVWWHGIADLVIINEGKQLAHSVDYKTSKNARYADTKQLDLVAAGLFAKFPKINRVKSALIFVVSKEFVKATHYREMMPKYLEKPAQDVARIEAALENGVWNPVSGPLCKFCAVRQCEYNRS
jgi:CRISPR/Cas system-associated exonuclease Cas4 (RecB family)